ncbi:hypothetical protein ACTFIZ_011476 [Dictyostelium cf. discoideum]
MIGETIQMDVEGEYNFKHLLASYYCIKTTQPEQTGLISIVAREDNEFFPCIKLSLSIQMDLFISSRRLLYNYNNPIGCITVIISPDNLFVNIGKYCLTFIGPQPIDITGVNTSFLSTLSIFTNMF